MSKIKFHITIMSAGKSAFAECVQFYTYALKNLGYAVTYADNWLDPSAINLVLGSYNATTWANLQAAAKHIIICNWEPVQINMPWFTPRYFRQMCHAHVWDYNHGNVQKLKDFGVSDVHLVPLAYVPEMTHIKPAIEQDIDVLFYGQPSEHRNKVLAAIKDKGLNLVSCESHGLILGEHRDDLIARAKVVLNMHYFDNTQAFEIVRVSYLLGNRKAVVAEVSAHTHIDYDIKNAVAHGNADELAQLCYDLVHDEPSRRELEQKGFDIFSRRNAAQVMKTAVDRYLAQTHYGNPIDHSVALPDILHIGAADKWNYSYCNIDKRADFAPDLTLDISQPLPFDQPLHSWRFGNVTLQRNSFQKIIAHNVFQRVDDLKLALTNCLELLAVGGNMELSVPLDLSYDAWMHIDDKRAFNDKTWENIINNWWQHGWGDYRFEIHNIGFGLHNEYGHQVLASNGSDWGIAMKTPRAIDTISVTLHKRPLKDDEPKQLPQTRFMD